MNALTKLSSKGQVVIPKDVRDALGWKEGVTLVVRAADGAAMIEEAAPKAERIDWAEFRRRMPRYDGPAVSVEEMEEAIDEMWRDRVSRRP